MSVPTDALPDDPDALKAMLLAERARAERLEQIIKGMQRHRFGRRAETLPEDQLLLGLEDVEQVAASDEAASEETVPSERTSRTAKRRMNRGSLPAQPDFRRQCPARKRNCRRAGNMRPHPPCWTA